MLVEVLDTITKQYWKYIQLLYDLHKGCSTGTLTFVNLKERDTEE